VAQARAKARSTRDRPQPHDPDAEEHGQLPRGVEDRRINYAVNSEPDCALYADVFIGIADFLDYLTRTGSKHLRRRLRFRDTGIEITECLESASAQWGKLSRDTTYKILLWDIMSGMLAADLSEEEARELGRDFSLKELYYEFWLVRAPASRRYRPKDTSYGLQLPIWGNADRTIKVYDQDPWERMYRANKAPCECTWQAKIWIALRDMIEWFDGFMHANTDYVRVWDVPWPMRRGGGGKGSNWGVDVSYNFELTNKYGGVLANHLWALTAPPRDFWMREGIDVGAWVPPLWVAPNGALWIYEYDPFTMIGA